MTPEQIERERVEFEVWAELYFPLQRDEDDNYKATETEDAWFIWCARAEQSAWISVNDRLPELDTPVHTLLDGQVGIFARCDDDSGGWLWARCYGASSWDNYGDWLQDDDYQSITHWQPLPTPPKGAGNA